MITEDRITNIAPTNVFVVGISSQNIYPKNIAKINAKYFRGVTKETSENLYDWVSHKFASPPRMPTMDRKSISFKLGKIQP